MFSNDSFDLEGCLVNAVFGSVMSLELYQEIFLLSSISMHRTFLYERVQVSVQCTLPAAYECTAECTIVYTTVYSQCIQNRGPEEIKRIGQKESNGTR